MGLTPQRDSARPRQTLLDRALDWSYSHPRARIAMREGWGLVRKAAHRTGLPAPFEPPELGDLRRVASSSPSANLDRTEGATVLILSMRGWSTHLALELTVALGLVERGIRPVLATCGGRLPICDVVPVHTAPPMPCHSCGVYATDAIEAAGFEPITVSDLIDMGGARRAARKRVDGLETVAACMAFSDGELPLGELVKVSAAWFLSRGTLLEDAETLRTYKHFLVSGLVLRTAFERLLDRVEPDRIFLLNGAFFAERILCEVAARRGIPAVRYEKGFLTDTVVVSPWRMDRDELDPGAAAWAEAKERPLEPDEASALDDYLTTRYVGGRTFDNLWRERIDDDVTVRRSLDLKEDRRVVSAFTNVLWDAAVLGRDRAFPSMGDWLLEAIGWTARHADIDLVIRIHPAETKVRNHVTRERMDELVASRYPTLPPNVRIVPSESTISSYSIMRLSTIGLVYSSTTGLEMAAQEMPVITAADTHYAGRGFTFDATTAEEYWSRLEQLLERPLDDRQLSQIRELARRYAYLFFFRFHQFIDVVQDTNRSRPRLRVQSSADLGPGKSPSFDRLLDACLGAKDPVVTPR